MCYVVPVVLPLVVTISVVTMVTVIATITIAVIFLVVFYSRNTRQLVSQILYISYDNSTHFPIEVTTEDVVPVSSNPAYEEVTMITRNIKMSENSA